MILRIVEIGFERALRCLVFIVILMALRDGQYVVLQWDRPLVDATLAGLDSVLPWRGLYSAAWDSEILRWPLWFAYVATFPVLKLILLFVRPAVAWRVLGIFALAGLLTVLIFGLFPALGPEHTYGVADRMSDVVQRLIQVRAGNVLVATDDMGLVSFPSFHAVALGLLWYAASGLRRPLRGVVWAYVVLALVSTAPMGGHYFVDIWAGLGLAWGVWAVIVLLPRVIGHVGRGQTFARNLYMDDAG